MRGHLNGVGERDLGMLKLSVLAGPDVDSVFSPESAIGVVGRGDDRNGVLHHLSIARHR